MARICTSRGFILDLGGGGMGVCCSILVLSKIVVACVQTITKLWLVPSNGVNQSLISSARAQAKIVDNIDLNQMSHRYVSGVLENEFIKMQRSIKWAEVETPLTYRWLIWFRSIPKSTVQQVLQHNYITWPMFSNLAQTQLVMDF